MIIACPQCGAKYRLQESEVADRSEVKVRCTKCGGTFTPAKDATDAAAATSEMGLPPNMDVFLRFTGGPLQGQTFPLLHPRVVLGRVEGDILVPDAEVSRRHCALEIYGPSATLRDLGSTNGTFVAAERVVTRRIAAQTEFRIGSSTVVFAVEPKA